MIDAKKNISVVIQGPIDDKTYQAIESYKKQGFEDIVVSTWEDQDLSLLEGATNLFELEISKYPNMKQIKSSGSKFYIAKTTLAGSQKSKNDYILKVRSDEFYPNLEKFISNFNKYPDKIHTTNNGFWKHIPACFSNHIFLCKKSLIINCCKDIIEYCMNNTQKDNICDEQAFGFFLIKNWGGSGKNWREEFKKHVFITPCHDLPDHLHSGQSSSRYKFKRHSDYPNNRPDGNHHNLKNLFNHCDEF